MQRPVQYIAQQGSPLEHSGSLQAGPTSVSIDSAMPKEYVGYYVGQSPLLGPQYTLGTASVPVLRDMPQHHGIFPPEQQQPSLDIGPRRISRSPSPLSHARSPSLSSDTQSGLLPHAPSTQTPQANRHAGEGPVIVNGSMSPAVLPQNPVRNTTTSIAPQLESDQLASELGPAKALAPHAPILNEREERGDSSVDERSRRSAGPKGITNGHHAGHTQNDKITLSMRSTTDQDATLPLPGPSPNFRTHFPPRLEFSPTIESITDPSSDATEPGGDQSFIALPSLLSPVKEQRTPSPTSSRSYATPLQMGTAARIVTEIGGKLANITNGAPAVRPMTETVIANGTTRLDSVWAKFHVTTAMESTQKSTAVQPLANVSNNANAAGQWQQATRKGHKKSKSNGTAKINGAMNAPGEPLPANDSERKGG